MAKIEIRDTVDKLEDIAVFLKRNQIEFSIVEDLANSSSKDVNKYRESDDEIQPLRDQTSARQKYEANRMYIRLV